MTRRDRTVVAGRGNHGLEQRVLGVFRENRTVLPAGPLVVGFSGGPDSLALLVMLAQLRPILGRELLALHIDHGLRPASRDESAVSERLAWELDVPFRVERLLAGLATRHLGAGVEEAARRERYRSAAVFCATVGGVFVTGHQADDQAETVLLHLLRGSGVAGAGAMRPVTRLSVPWWDTMIRTPATSLTLVRPLLDTRRGELERYLAERRPDLRPVLDPTNASDRYRRNAVRHRLLPEAERIFPGAVDALNRFARISAEESDLLDVIAGTALISATDPARRLSRAALTALPVAIARRVVRGWLQAVLPGVETTMERVEAIRDLAASAGNSWTAEVGAGATVRCDGDLLVAATDVSTGTNR